MTKPSQLPKHQPPSPALIVGSILAMGVIRILERQHEREREREREKDLDNLTEQRVSTEVPTTQEKDRD